MIRLRSLSLAVAVAFAFAPLAHAEDLISIYHEARNSDPQLAAAEATRNATSENVSQARALLLPQLGASYRYERSHNNNIGPEFRYDEQGNASLVNVSSSGTSFGTSLGGTLNQSILDLGQWTNLKASKAQARAGDATYDAAEQELLIRVANAYFAVLNSEDALSFSQSNERALNRQMEQAQQRFEVGLTAITDVNDAKAQHDTAVAKVIRAQNLVDDNKEALRQLTGQQLDGLYATATHGDAHLDRLCDFREVHAGSAPDLAIATSGCGQLIGGDNAGNAVTVPVFGPGVSTTEIVGELYLARQIVLRAMALGARALVHTDRPQSWRLLSREVADPAQLRTLAGPEVPVDQLREYSVLVVDGPALDAPTLADGATVIIVRSFDDPTSTSPDVRIRQDRLDRGRLTIERGGRSVPASLVTIPDETRLIGQPDDAVLTL